MRILVTGGRDYADSDTVRRVLSDVHKKHGISEIIHGGARGADTLCAQWAAAERIPVQQFRAEWEKHGKAAGPLRNQRMIDEGAPDACIAFHGGAGTADMVRRVRAAGFPLWEVSRTTWQPLARPCQISPMTCRALSV